MEIVDNSVVTDKTKSGPIIFAMIFVSLVALAGVPQNVYAAGAISEGFAIGEDCHYII